MDSASVGTFGLMKEKLRFMSERQKVIAQNVANANTPDYRAKDLEVDFGALLKGQQGKLAMAVTNPSHNTGTKSSGSQFKLVKNESSEITPVGNNVVLEEELMRMQQNNMDYQATIELYKKMSRMIAAALGER